MVENLPQLLGGGNQDNRNKLFISSSDKFQEYILYFLLQWLIDCVKLKSIEV